MATTWLHRLQANFKSARTPCHLWAAGDGKLLISPYAARVLGGQLPGVEGNVFWHDPALEDTKSARACLDSAGPFGGDRLWIAPEAGYIFTNLRTVQRDPGNSAKLPTQMDPADWSIREQTPGHMRLGTHMDLKDNRSGHRIQLRVERQFNVIHRPDDLPASINCLSFTITNQLTILKADRGAIVGLWDLLQLPTGGVLVLPTLGRVAKPQRYYDAFDPQHLQCDAQAVRFTIDGSKRLKLGLSNTQTTGRMGYFRKVGSKAVCILRSFLPQPGLPYADVPSTWTKRVGVDALQAYNDVRGPWSFGEMEYHEPALIAGTQPASRSGVCVTHVLAGAEKSVRAFGSRWLGATI